MASTLFLASRYQFKNFYVYADQHNAIHLTPAPTGADDAMERGLLVIEQSTSDTFYLCIQNNEYFGSLPEMENILYEWAISENYKF